MRHLNRLAALALSVSMGISGCAFAPASSASSETVSSTYEKDMDNGETFSAESADSEETSIDDTGAASLSPSEQSSETEEENDSETDSEREAAFAQKIKRPLQRLIWKVLQISAAIRSTYPWNQGTAASLRHGMT